MSKQFWINLPVKDLERSKTFFQHIGFKFDTNSPGNTPVSACMLMGEQKVVVMLFTDPAFQGFTAHPVADTAKGTEVLFSMDAESREAVDELARKVVEAGGTVYGKPGDSQGWMYGFGFADPDGHRWNAVFMDMSKLPK